jgi:hypothetical protein
MNFPGPEKINADKIIFELLSLTVLKLLKHVIWFILLRYFDGFDGICSARSGWGNVYSTNHKQGNEIRVNFRYWGCFS